MIETFLSGLEHLNGAALGRTKRIVEAFRKIPYENLTKIIRFEERRTDALRGGDDLLGGFLQDGSGGTCFSIVNALQETLARTGVASRVCLADRSYGPDTHCALLAQIDGREWLLDPGFLIYEPVPFPEGSARAPGGRIEWTLDGDKVEAETVFANGCRKRRYTLKLAPVSRDDFIGAWRKSFDFEMMLYPVITRILDDGRHIYLRDGHLMVDGKYVRMVPTAEIPGVVGEWGIRSDLARQALEILGKQ